MKIKALKGVNDILPDQINDWNYILDQACRKFKNYGYRQIVIPIIEESRLFTRGIGEETDIVEKEMYSFLDRGKRTIALRPEATASVVRAYLEHNMNEQGLVKLFYSGAMFRGEKPQAGRNRQFYQIGVEALGSSNPYLDAETIYLAVDFLKHLNLRSFKLLINTVGSNQDKELYSKRLKNYFKDKLDHLCKNCQNRFQRSVLRILDCKNPACRKLINLSPLITESLCENSQSEFMLVKELLLALGIEFTESNHLVRGLDYYTKTVFEIVHAGLGAQNTILAGGRYDNLVSELGGTPTGAIGFAAGIERLLLALTAENIKIPRLKNKSVYIIGLGINAHKKTMKIANDLRQFNIPTQINLSEKSLKSLMRQANKLGSDYVLILGDNELETNSIIIKDMEKGTQTCVPLDSLNDQVSNLIENNK